MYIALVGNIRIAGMKSLQHLSDKCLSGNLFVFTNQGSILKADRRKELSTDNTHQPKNTIEKQNSKGTNPSLALFHNRVELKIPSDNDGEETIQDHEENIYVALSNIITRSNFIMIRNAVRISSMTIFFSSSSSSHIN